MSNPTTQTYSGLTDIYDFLNKEFFNGDLPHCLITMQRHKGAFGFFCGERFTNTNEEITDEIALNPSHLSRKIIEVISTLLHEMVHLWQHHFGKPPRKSYHNKEWSNKMLEIGLIPTSTGEIGGKKTGQKMTHLIDENCAIDDNIQKKKLASKTKYTCPSCGLNAWAKPESQLMCSDCQELMKSPGK